MNKFKHNICLLLLLTVFSLAGCSRSDDTPFAEDIEKEISTVEEDKTQNSNIDFRSVMPGRLLVKLTPEAMKNIEPMAAGAAKLRSTNKALGRAFTELKVLKMQPYFHDGEKYRERRKAFGLDRWMVVYFDETTPTASAYASLRHFKDFEYVEVEHYLQAPSVSVTPVSQSELRSIERDRDKAMPANDPLLPKQWHYHNTGSLDPLSVAGADINLFEAWKVTTGKKNVVVAVVDGGIDPTHEDLIDNLDVENSYNFVFDLYGNEKGKGKIYPDGSGHGTHVAGTIAAVSNNGKGVSGIAGGDGTPGSGVTLINAQIFGQGSERSSGGAKAIVWSADNTNAVISQNSWGYRYPGPKDLPQVDKEAIDYFIANAGMDDKGKQRADSPMAGGIVIFAAGNDGMDYTSWPGAYEACVSVSSMAWDFVVAPYSNRGTWADIMAPGGDQERFTTQGGVLSTLPKTRKDGTGYGYMQGTSMACPHVSGVAALIVSVQGRMGFTNEMLKKQLLTSLRPYDINRYNPYYTGRLGVGYVDAGAAVEIDKGKTPEMPKGSIVSTDYTEAVVEWNVVKDEDAPSSVARYYHLFVSDKEITKDNISSLKPITIYGEAKALGKKITQKVTGLQDGTQYYFALRAGDRFEHFSPLNVFSGKTVFNNAPEITSGLPKGEIVIQNNKSHTINLTATDKDGHEWEVSKQGDLRGVNVARNKDRIAVEINPVQKAGKYAFTLTLTDRFGKAGKYTINYQIAKYDKPAFSNDLKAMAISLNAGQTTLDLSDMVHAANGLTLKLSARSSETKVVEVKVEGKNLIITPKMTGKSIVTLEASDGMNRSTTTINIHVVENVNGIVSLIYPIPAKDNLNLLFGKKIESATVVISSLQGEQLIRKDIRPNKSGVATIDVHTLAAGTYRIHVSSKEGVYKSTFLKH